MPQYPGGGQAKLLRPNQQGYCFNNEAVTAGEASIAFELGRIQDDYPWGVSFEFRFASNPGNFQYDVQTSDSDQPGTYVSESSLTGGLNANFVGRIELPSFWARYVRVQLVSIQFATNSTVQVTR